MINLLSNAIQFTERGTIHFKVHIDETSESDETIRARFEVVDTGVGLNQEDIARIFTPFEQVGTIGEGTGLGLAISKNLAEMMETQIHVESVVGEGSRFWFDLTLLKVKSEEKIVQENDHRIIGYHGEPRRVLVVDDEKRNRELIIDLLGPLGFKTFMADSALEALAQVQTIHPHVILMDLKMPNLNGLEATHTIRRFLSQNESAGVRPVIIAHSASAFESDKDKSIEAGCDDFLAKPVKREDLLKLLGKYLALDWVYSDEAPEFHPLTKSEITIIPDDEEMAILLDLAKSGRLRRIMNRAEGLRCKNPDFIPFADMLTELAQGFQEKKLLAFIQSYMESQKEG